MEPISGSLGCHVKRTNIGSIQNNLKGYLDRTFSQTSHTFDAFIKKILQLEALMVWYRAGKHQVLKLESVVS